MPLLQLSIICHTAVYLTVTDHLSAAASELYLLLHLQIKSIQLTKYDFYFEVATRNALYSVSGAIFHYGYLQVYTKEVDSLGTFSQELSFKY